jgi:hypothetical protein
MSSGSSKQATEGSELTALTALHSAEIGANVGELQVTTSLALALLAFLSVAGFAFDSISPGALLLTPAVVTLVCTYLLIRVAVVIRRAALARAYEERIAEIGGFGDEVRARQLGSAFYGAVDDIQVIRTVPASGVAARLSKFCRWVFAAIAASGAYLIAMGYTAAVVVNAGTREDPAPKWQVIAAAVGYTSGWGLFCVAAFLLVIRGVRPPDSQSRRAPHSGRAVHEA